MKTYFAPPERLSKQEVMNQYGTVSSYEFVREIFDALPHIAMIINMERQVVYSNNILLEIFGLSDIADAVGQRPGELFGCVHALETESGCGTSTDCRYCGALSTILESWEKNRKVSREARLTSVVRGKEAQFDLMVTSAPFEKNGNRFAIVSLNDIGNEKRRRSLERVFFHDIINSAGGLRGLMDILVRSDDPKKAKEFIPMACDLSEMLMDEILAQKDLLAAENDELYVMEKSANAIKIVQQAVQQIRHHTVAREKAIIIDPMSDSVDFVTDQRLLKRVIVNMLKNAMEASSEGAVVRIGCHLDDGAIRFVVSNSGHIPAEVQAQLFQRSFSTKGANRGIGTYSMKLFTEGYLGGKIAFTSSRENGTSFSATIPVRKNE